MTAGEESGRKKHKAAPSTTATRPRGTPQVLFAAIGYLLAALLLAGALGQIFRDRWIVTQLLMHLPLLLIALVALLLDLLRRGRGLRRIPFGLTVLALPCLAWSIHAQVVFPVNQVARGEPVRVMQWNVQWGGGRSGDEAAWQDQCRIVAERRPDIVILNEAPDPKRLHLLDEVLDSPTPALVFENPPKQSYWYRLVIASRWPVRTEGVYRLPNGAAISAVVESPHRDYRILAVDGVSTPTVSRLPLLREISQMIVGARMLGQPYDVIAGDFNTTSRSIGFDAFRAARFDLASGHIAGWRATFPSICPLYDIDHVWTSPLWRTTQGRRFSQHSTTNHRGQLIVLHRAVASAK